MGEIRRTGLSKVVWIFVLLSVFLGCAASNKNIFISENFKKDITSEILTFPIIDARTNKGDVRDIKEIDGYKEFWKRRESELNYKGYTVKHINHDVKECPPLRDIQDISSVGCLQNAGIPSDRVILLLSVDKYEPPNSIAVTGILYLPGKKNILWKNNIGSDSDAGLSQAAFYGLGGMLGYAVASSFLSDERKYTRAAYTAFYSLMNSISPLTEQHPELSN